MCSLIQQRFVVTAEKEPGISSPRTGRDDISLLGELNTYLS